MVCLSRYWAKKTVQSYEFVSQETLWIHYPGPLDTGLP